jgi:hypothetical protein
MLEHEIYGCAVEGWANYQTTHLNLKWHGVEREKVHANASSVAHHLGQAAQGQDNGIGANAVAKAEKNIRKKCDCEYRSEKAIDPEINTVSVCGVFDGALFRDVNT